MSPLFRSAMMLSVMLLAACSESPESTVEEQVQSTQAAPEAAPAKESATSGGGGYVPSDSERIPGITLTQEELDKMYAEARANTPTPVIPEDAK